MIVYIIKCKRTNIIIYVGITANFYDRMSAHKNNSKRIYSKLYIHIRNEGGWNNFIMEKHNEIWGRFEAQEYEKNMIHKLNPLGNIQHSK